MQLSSGRSWNFIGFLLCCALLLVALYLQFAMNMVPCPLCLLTRAVVALLGIVLLIAAIHHPKAAGLRGYGALTLLLSLFGIALAARHVWLQSQPLNTSTACVPGLGILFQTMPLKDVLKLTLTGSGDCAHMGGTLFGVSITLWTLIAFIFFAIMATLQTFRRYPR